MNVFPSSPYKSQQEISSKEATLPLGGFLNGRSLFRWGTKGVWAVLDQLLFAAANFGVNIFLARWLTPAEFGSFAIAFSIFFLVGSFHTALLAEPMLVFGSSKYRECITDYFHSLLRWHWRLSATFAVIGGTLGMVLWHFTSNSTALSLSALALSCPFILHQWLLRRATYVALQPKLATYAGLLYILVLLAGIHLLHSNDWLSGPSAIGMIASASIFSAIFLTYKLGLTRRTPQNTDFINDCWTAHWEYGRWSLGVSGVSWARNNAYLLLLPLWGGLSAAGAFKALMILIQPIGQVITALSILILPVLSASTNNNRFKAILFFSGVLSVIVTGINWTILVLFGKQILNFLFAGQYAEYGQLLVIVGLLPLLSAGVTLAARGLQAIERPERVFKVDLWSTLISLPLGALLLFLYEILGAIVALIFTFTVALIFMNISLKRELI
jgi:O-antigen/teichoic acid export membrane protein